MAVFTTLTKQKLSWPAPPLAEITRTAYEFLISDSYKLDVGGYYLTIQPASVETVYTTTPKASNGLSWTSPSSEVTDVFFEITDGYNLLISDSYKLIIDPARGETIWTKIEKSNFN